MAKWLVKTEQMTTIITADTLNAALQIARTAFGPDVVVRPMTDEQASGMGAWLDNLADARAAGQRLVNHLRGYHDEVKRRIGRKDVPDHLIDALCALAHKVIPSGLEAWDAPFVPDILDHVLRIAEQRTAWATCIARMQELIWAGDDRLGAEDIGFDRRLVDMVEAGASPSDILGELDVHFRVPAQYADDVHAIVIQLATLHRPELAINWAEYYAGVISAVAAACQFEMDLS